MVAHLLWEQRAAGSNPVASTKKHRRFVPSVFFYKQDLKLKKVRMRKQLYIIIQSMDFIRSGVYFAFIIPIYRTVFYDVYEFILISVRKCGII